MHQIYTAAILLGGVLLHPTGMAAQMSDATVAAQQALSRMDSRRAVPLPPLMAKHQKENMREHLAVVQEIIAAAASDDFTAVERATSRIGYSEQMGQMCTHMGAAAPGFTEQALIFHRTADSIAVAARQHDRDGVLRALSNTLQACTACHSGWKQEVVDDATWSHLTGGDVTAHHGTTP